MRISSFKEVATLYERSASTTITRHRIEHHALGKFCDSLHKFDSRVGKLNGEDYWKKCLKPLKILQFELCAAPIPKENRFECVSTLASELQNHLLFCQKMYPGLADHAFNILNFLTELRDDPNDPLLDKLLELTGVKEKVAWVIKESRLIPPVEELVAGLNLPRLSVIHPLQLKNLTCYDQLIVIGPSFWFPESVFTAARTSLIDIMIFDWIIDRWKPQNVFVSPHKSSGPSNRKYITLEEGKTSSYWDGIDPESLLNIVDKASSVDSILSGGDLEEYEKVGALCIFFEDYWAVFIDASEEAKTLVIDPDEDEDNRISRILVKEIIPGMFILVRTSGGGDYIVPVANKIMGNQSQQAREYQNRWKDLLRNYAKITGLIKTSLDLIDRGSNLADEINVRNWMSPRNIRTREYDDFLAIMRLVGLEDAAQEYWTMMKHINKAHIKAGFEIRKWLLEQVKDLNMETLQKHGKMDFKLSDDDEGGLTAFRIESILPETLEVPYSSIGLPFKL